MNLRRALLHLCMSDWQRRRAFPDAVLERIEQAVRECEGRHAGQIRFVVETALPWAAVWGDQPARERALELFAAQRVWDTEYNNGVLIYVLLADRDVEIVADRGVAGGIVAPGEWESCCRIMEEHFRAGRFEAGAIAGIDAVAAALARHPPGPRTAGNELSDRPVVL
ncbi:MAG: TPM domain-containing protein [Sinimarinibacterium sp.]|jgi:uncharacterized membrane protein